MDVGDAAVVMDRLAVSESGGLSGVGDELWERAVVLAGRLNVVYAELVAVAAQVIAAQAWGGQGGVRSPEHWLALRAGLAPGTAAQVVAVARARTRLPVVSGLFASGVLSLDQAAAVVTRVPVAYDAGLPHDFRTRVWGFSGCFLGVVVEVEDLLRGVVPQP